MIIYNKDENGGNSLSKGARSEHFSHKVDISICCINPRCVKFHYVSVLQRLEEVNFTVKPLEIFRALQKIIQFNLIPSNFNPLVLIKCSISEPIRNKN